MEEVPRARGALHETIADIEPEPFRRKLESVVAESTLTPAVLTVQTASAIDSSADLDAARKRGAGVQLSYEGLSLTRQLVGDEPWDGSVSEDIVEQDLELIVAETLVARGFQCLATTGVRTAAIQIARRFGRNQTWEHRGDTPRYPSLEVEVVELAVRAGADLALSTVPPRLAEYATALAEDIEAVPLPPPDEALLGVRSEIGDLVATADPGVATNVSGPSGDT